MLLFEGLRIHSTGFSIRGIPIEYIKLNWMDFTWNNISLYQPNVLCLHNKALESVDQRGIDKSNHNRLKS